MFLSVATIAPSWITQPGSQASSEVPSKSTTASEGGFTNTAPAVFTMGGCGRAGSWTEYCSPGSFGPSG